LRNLVDQFHQAGIKIILDMVVNHTGYHTPSYMSYPDKFFDETHFNHGEGSVEGELSGLPDLDHDQVDVADYFIQNILRWIEETGIDGIRMDTVKHVESKFWYLFKSQIKTRHPGITLIGEVLDWDIDYLPSYQKDHDFDAVFDFPLCGTTKGTLVWDQPMTNLARPRLNEHEIKGVLDKDSSYTNANRLITLLDNHDLDRRIMSEILDKVHHWDRNLALEIMKLTLSFLMTTRGIPQIYYGTEIGMTGYRDPDNRKDMPWDKFDDNMEPVDLWEKEIFSHLVSLITLRKEHRAITCGYLLTLYASHFIYAYLREHQGNILIVVINNGLGPMEAPVAIKIHENANIPSRIKNALAEGTLLKSYFTSTPDVPLINGGFSVQLGRKTAGIYFL
jgi:alpha-amylase